MLNIILLAAFATFLGYRLYKTLGNSKYDHDLSGKSKKTYEEYKDFVLKEGVSNNDAQHQATIFEEEEPDLNDAEKQIVKELTKYNPSFTISKFLKGAKFAFEEILKAYSSQDQATLRKLCVGKALETFINDIEHFKSNSQIKNVSLVSVQNPVIKSITNNGSEAEIKVKFDSEQISSVVDKISGNLISGSVSKITNRTDTFIFSKKINSNSNIWFLIQNDSK